MGILDILNRAFESGQSPFRFLSREAVWQLVSSEDEDIRIQLAKALAFADPSDNAAPVLCCLLEDLSCFVRVEAADSLSAFPNPISFEALCGAFSDRDELVRAYAIFGAAMVGSRIDPEKAVAVLREADVPNESDRVRVSLYGGLYALGQQAYWQQLVSLLDAEDYLVRCAVLNTFGSIVNTDNADKIHSVLENLAMDDACAAVKSAYAWALTTTEEIMK